MIYFSKIEDSGQDLQFAVSQDAILVLRISLKSNFVAPAVLQPRLEDWIARDGTILKAMYKANPAYLYVSPNSITHFTLTITIPSGTEAEKIWSSSLHFSTYQHCVVKLQIQLVDRQKNKGDLEEYYIDLELPWRSPATLDSGNDTINRTEQTVKLLSMLAGLEILPAKWLVAELILCICERGIQASEEEEFRHLASSLTKTRFFKNAVLVFSATQFVHWVLVGLSVSAGLQAVTARKKNSFRMFHHWEEWLMNLAGQDIESSDENTADLHFPDGQHYESVVHRIGMEPDRWLLYLLLGLMRISPRQKAIIEQICKQAPENKKRDSGKGKRKVKNVMNEKGSLQK